MSCMHFKIIYHKKIQNKIDVSKSFIMKAVDLFELDQLTTIATQISALQNQVNNQFSFLNLGYQQSPMNMAQQTQTWCEVCGNNDHSAYACATN